MNGPNAIFATVAAVLLFAGGCDLVEYHPYDTRITGRTGINAANARRIDEACAGRRSIRFALVSDTSAGTTIRAMPWRRSTAWRGSTS